MSLEGVPGRRLLLPELVFRCSEDAWPSGVVLPTGPLPRMRVPWLEEALGVPELPVLFGSLHDGSFVHEDGGTLRLGVDVFGAAFVLLTRLEELRPISRDDHDRFPASASIASRLGILDRPLADEYTELLRCALVRLFRGFSSTKPPFTVEPTHDIDFIDGRTLGVKRIVRASAADLARSRAPGLACRRLASILLRPVLGGRADVFNTFSDLMSLSERYGLRSTFHFIADRRPGGIADANYEIEEPWVRSVLRSIDARGHAVALHGSYQSYLSAEQLLRERDRLVRVLREEEITPIRLGCRQHFLRFDPQRTWAAQEAAGIEYDSSSGFADAPGFRSGTCREHPVFDLLGRRRLELREKPLIVMDASLLDAKYLGLDADQAGDTAERLKRACRRVGGGFVVLWHNTAFVSPHERALFEAIVAC